MSRFVRQIFFGLLLSSLAIFMSATVHAEQNEVRVTDITQSVVQMTVKQGLPLETVGEILIAKAKERGLVFAGRKRIYKALRKRGIEMPHLEIFQFCNPEDARQMILRDPIYAAYMPCRIALVEDVNGTAWLMMLNLDMLINSKMLPVDLNEIAVRINQAMLAVMVAAATGEQ